MSGKKITAVVTPHGEFLIDGHVESSEVALDRYREYLEEEARRIAAQLVDLDEGLGEVYHQTGTDNPSSRREVLDGYGPGPWLMGGGS